MELVDILALEASAPEGVRVRAPSGVLPGGLPPGEEILGGLQGQATPSPPGAGGKAVPYGNSPNGA